MPGAPSTVKFRGPQEEIFTWDDGWKLVEVKSSDDLTTLGQATFNCIGRSWELLLLPRPENELEVMARRFKETWDTPDNRRLYGDAWVEEKIQGYRNCPLSKRYFKIMAVLDAEGKARAAVILGEQEAVDSKACSYSGYRDLGQESTVELDGNKFKLLQATFGTAWTPRDVAEHLRTWWESASEGDWNEEEYERKLKHYEITAKYYSQYPAAVAA